MPLASARPPSRAVLKLWFEFMRLAADPKVAMLDPHAGGEWDLEVRGELFPRKGETFNAWLLRQREDRLEPMSAAAVQWGYPDELPADKGEDLSDWAGRSGYFVLLNLEAPPYGRSPSGCGRS